MKLLKCNVCLQDVTLETNNMNCPSCVQEAEKSVKNVHFFDSQITNIVINLK